MKVLVLPGDGIGQEVAAAAVKVLKAVEPAVELDYALLGGSAYDETGSPFPDETKAKVDKADAVLMGAVGGLKWDTLPGDKRPEAGLLGIRAHMGVFANLRPAKIFKPLVDASTLKAEVLEGVDLLIVRELIGGVYFGKPAGIETRPDGTRYGYNTMAYSTPEIRRVVKVAFEAAQKRGGKLCSVDKANVLDVSRLWRSEVEDLHKDFSDVSLSHMYVDNCAMQLIRAPKQFDVVVTSNLFGDILSDAAAMITGSLGMLPSASLGESTGLYEPVHGSAPDIAGQDKANPIGMILSTAMMLKYSFDRSADAERIENAVERVLAAGYRTGDLPFGAVKLVGTSEMTDLILKELA